MKQSKSGTITDMKKNSENEKPEDVQRFLPKTSPRGQPIGNRKFKILSSKVRPVWNGNNL